MSRVQLALRASDLDGSITFYSSLFGVEPAKLRPGYANFAITEPPLKLVLIEGDADQPTVMDHLGVEVETTAEVNDATDRLSALGLFTQVEDDTECCYALQDKVWVHGPGAEQWEIYTVKADAPDATSIHPWTSRPWRPGAANVDSPPHRPEPPTPAAPRRPADEHGSTGRRRCVTRDFASPAATCTSRVFTEPVGLSVSHSCERPPDPVDQTAGVFAARLGWS